MKKILLFLTLLISFTLTAQDFLVKKIELKWSENSTIYLEKGVSWQIPHIKNNTINVALKIPTFSTKWKIPSNQKVVAYNLKNPIYKTISKKELQDTSIKNIPEEHQIKAIVSSTRDQYLLFVSLSPLLKKNNVIKQLISFELHYKLETDTSAKSSDSYTSTSVLATGNWYKFSVDTTGVYKLNYDFLKNIGIDVKNVNPKNISIYGNGGGLLPYRIGDTRYDDLQENAIYFQGESDGKFDNNDYLLFYARGPEKWTHDGTPASLEHQRNIYSDHAYYFVHVKNQEAKRISIASDITATSIIEYTTFDDYIVHEIDKRNLFQMGQSWLGEAFDIENEQTIFMNFKDIDTSFPLRINVKAVASHTETTYMPVSIKGTELFTLSFSPLGEYTPATEKVGTISNFMADSEQIEIKLTYENDGIPSAKAYLDYIEIIGKKKLIASNKQFSFRNLDLINEISTIDYSIKNPSNIKQVWDVTDPINPKNVLNKGTDNFTFTAQGGIIREYIVLSENDYYLPNSLNNPKIGNQNLHALSNVDYVIITQSFLVNEAEKLAQYHRDHNDLNVKVIPLHQIYNEFGSGSSDITAIRDFVKFLYDTSSPHLQYIMMYGDTSYDPKGKFEKSENIVPTYHSKYSFSNTDTFVTDDYFAIVSHNNEGYLDSGLSNSGLAQTQDIAISRIPVRTIKEAKEITDKLLHYYSKTTFGDWRNQIAMMADDPDDRSGGTLQINEEALADNITQNKRVFNIKKLYADAYQQVISSAGASYPEMNKDITNTIEKGVLIANYFGHGGEDGLAAERLLTTQEIESWNNYDKLPLIMIISCEFARLDNPSRPNTAGELVLRNPHGAAASHIATARAVYIGTGNDLNSKLIPLLLSFNGENNSISENLRIAKNSMTDKQRFFVFSLGDPAMKLAVPKPDISITHMNNKPITQPLDTLKALSYVTFKGVIKKSNGDIDTDFNGKLTTTIYDKVIDKETLNNDGILDTPMPFDTQESKLFRGNATVTDGEFIFEFIVPKDIRIAYGKGKLSFYAENGERDKAGYNIDVTVGGINEDAPEDNLGPSIQLFMNDKSFIDGGTTNQSPLLLAFFEDENGINTSLSSVDHDIVAILDDDQLNPIILNDYYSTELNTYKKGSLEYRLRNLEVGLHTIHVKAYDTYNNHSEATLGFRVLDDGKLVLEHVLNYPNPFVNYTEFWFNHNKPTEPLEVQVQIYTVSGKLVKTINQLVQNKGSLSRDIQWDGLDDFGQKIGKGVYVYKLSVKATISGLKAEKFEKLVILQ